MSVTGWIIAGIVVFLVLDGIVYVRWVKRAKAARDRGEPAPPLRWPF
jgi:hypothetical protein